MLSLCTPCFPCADPGFLVRGVGRGGGGEVPGQSDKRSPDNVFFSPQLILLKSNNFEENYHFSRFQRGSNIFQGGGGEGGGVQLFPGGSNCLYPIETHITCDFPGGSGPPHLLSRPAGDSFFSRLVVVGWYFSVLF